MSTEILHISDDFLNIRGSFKIAGLVDIGTHASLIRRNNGKFVFLDSCTLSAAAEQKIDELTNGGEAVEAVLNLHPFHTIHVPWMHRRFPHAHHYGTVRHLARFPELTWQKTRTEDPELHELFSQDLEFSVPRGVDFIADDENVHFSSVLAYHRASCTIHVDDTLMYIRFPGIVRGLGLKDTTSFHPTLARVLEQRAGATGNFREWAEQLAEKWRKAKNLCAAHTAALMERDNEGASIRLRILKALEKVGPTLKKHERKFGS